MSLMRLYYTDIDYANSPNEPYTKTCTYKTTNGLIFYDIYGKWNTMKTLALIHAFEKLMQSFFNMAELKNNK